MGNDRPTYDPGSGDRPSSPLSGTERLNEKVQPPKFEVTQEGCFKKENGLEAHKPEVGPNGESNDWCGSGRSLQRALRGGRGGGVCRDGPDSYHGGWAGAVVRGAGAGAGGAGSGDAFPVGQPGAAAVGARGAGGESAQAAGDLRERQQGRPGGRGVLGARGAARSGPPQADHAPRGSRT